MKKSTYLFLRGILFLGLLALSAQAAADRTVRFIPSGKNIKVSNPSASSLTYSITCKKSDGSLLSNQTGISIPPGQSKEHPVSGAVGGVCSGGATASNPVAYLNGMVRCEGSPIFTFAMAQSACQAGYHLCNVQEWVDNRNGDNITMGAWLSEETFTAEFSTGWPAWSMNYFLASNAPVTEMSSSATCYTAADGAGTSYPYCNAMAKANMQSRYMCCSSPNGFCQITVSGTDGYLITPDFKGGTPF